MFLNKDILIHWVFSLLKLTGTSSLHTPTLTLGSTRPLQLPVKLAHLLQTFVWKTEGIVVTSWLMYPQKKPMAEVVGTMSPDRGTTYPDLSPLVVYVVRLFPMIQKFFHDLILNCYQLCPTPVLVSLLQ